MAGGPSLRLPSFALALLGLALIGVAACSGGGRPRFDPDRAEDLAHAALLTAAELPREGWTVVATDEFDDEVDAYPSELSSSCRELLYAGSQAEAELDATQVGRARRELQRGAPNLPFPVSVTATVWVLPEEAAATEAVGALSRTLNDPGFVDCFGEGLRLGIADPGATTTARPASTLAPTPADGAAVAGEIVVRSEESTAELRFEYYVWQYANAAVDVWLFGPREAFTQELVETAVAAMEARVVETAAD